MLSQLSFSQESYSVDGVDYELKTETSGALTLLWNVINQEYRYFIKQGNTIVELKNTKGADNKYQEEYKTILNDLTSNTISTKRLKLTLPDLTDFVNKYNASVDSSFKVDTKKIDIESSLMLFGGVTNHPYITNNENTAVGQFGAEFEVFESTNAPKHVLYFALRHSLDSDELKYKLTQLSLGYRYRFINKESFNIHGHVAIVNYNFVERNAIILIDDMYEEQPIKENGLDVPFAFGIGADIKVSEKSFITFRWNVLFAIFLDDL